MKYSKLSNKSPDKDQFQPVTPLPAAEGGRGRQEGSRLPVEYAVLGRLPGCCRKGRDGARLQYQAQFTSVGDYRSVRDHRIRCWLDPSRIWSQA
jgi:hypothetical protein